ncbi:DUF4286 family protein [Aestuariivivens sediminicola]|uniref:DUF4286 family protein n=1 Tax=Aestuariivivens sediminicola TaxID=2913560 RepID=UPI001F58A7CC|nr:DUF4286 family protein [Aestuariivivens sediminicola]
MKIIYNVTVNVDDTVHDEWLLWIKEHIHQVLATGKFDRATLSRVLVEEDMGGITYSIQYRSYSRATLEAYYNEDADQLRAEGYKRFSDKMVAFRTELEVIDEFSIN